MGRCKKGTRVRGPYERKTKAGVIYWRVRIFEGDGTPSHIRFASKESAEAFIRETNEEIETNPNIVGVGECLDRYELYLRITKENKDGSVKGTMGRLRRLLEVTALLDYYSEPRCRAIYNRWSDDRPREEGKKRWATDTHRNYLAEVKTFFDWVVSKRFMSRNPWSGVDGIGKRKTGKFQLRLAEARKFYRKVMELAEGGEVGATAALCALVLAMRTSEVVHLTGRDVDDDNLVWVADSKTEAGKRSLEAPSDLHALLQDLAQSAGPNRYLFRSTRGKRGHRDRKWVNTWVHNVCTFAGVPDVCAHSLRGLHATLAREHGATGTLVAGTLGHENVKMQERAYAKREAIENVARQRGFALISGGKK